MIKYWLIEVCLNLRFIFFKGWGRTLRREGVDVEEGGGEEQVAYWHKPAFGHHLRWVL